MGKNDNELDVLLLKDYSEMTSEEIEKVIDFKVQVATQSEDFQQRLEVQRERIKSQIEDAKATSNTLKASFESIVSDVNERWKNVK